MPEPKISIELIRMEHLLRPVPCALYPVPWIHMRRLFIFHLPAIQQFKNLIRKHNEM